MHVVCFNFSNYCFSGYRSLDELYDWLNENRDFVISSQWRVNSSAWGRWLDAREEDPHLRGTETTYEEYLRWVEARDEETIMTESDGEDGSGAARPQLGRYLDAENLQTVVIC